MPNRIRHLAAACLVLALAACTPPTTINVDGARVSVRGDGSVQLRAPDGGRAAIAADGALTIDGEPVEVDAQQQALLRDYRDDLAGVRQAALDIAGQGVALGGKAVTEALKGVLSGDPSDIEQRIDAEAATIEAEAEKLEARAERLKTRQREIARQLPRLRPYLIEDGAELAEALTDGEAS
ncbi:DUF2884 family protein [Luteimonas sp. RD2P54]|uniref:DUF2884 family protein n=1 Tax=Luteimonas endophytica TaxID=3042023 RepID=A0ABT6J8Q9_9GAMM|nr:DUF2884 family protein [Luteimonas endophytica]MDH5823200.1 DUF2884 family protein [Luteimonas endophytica]